MDESKTKVASTSNNDEKFELKKRIGLLGGMALTTGAIVGTGIFVSPVGVLRAVNGSIGLSLAVWVACGIIAILSALCYCELGTTFGASGGDLNNFNLAYGPVVAFLYAWTNFMILLGGGASVQIFSRYLVASFFPDGCEIPESVIKLFGILVVLSVTHLNCKSVKISMWAEIAIGAVKYLAMGVIAVGGIASLASGNLIGLKNFESAFESRLIATLNVSNFAQAFYQGLFPYNGWPVLMSVTEEIKDMKHNLPRACILSVVSVIIMYLAVNVGYFSVLTVDEMLSSKAVGVIFASKVLGGASWFIPLAVCISTLGNMNGAWLAVARPPFVAARAGWMPKALAMIHVRYFTPAVAVMTNCAVTVVYVLIGDFDTLIYAFGFTSWVFYGLSAGSVLILRWKMPDIPRPYRVPLPIPVMVCLVAVTLVIAPFIQHPDPLYFWALGFYAVVLLGYYVFIFRKVRIPGLSRFYLFLQQLLQVAETDFQGFPYQLENK